jgi:hypothetical protein
LIEATESDRFWFGGEGTHDMTTVEQWERIFELIRESNVGSEELLDALVWSPRSARRSSPRRGGKTARTA